MTKPIEEITSLETLQEMRNSEAKGIGELRDKFNSRGDKEKGQPGKWEGDEAEKFERSSKNYDAITRRMDELRASNAIEQRWNEINEDQQRSHRDTRNTPINDPQNKPEITPEIRNLAFQGWFRRESQGNVSEAQQRAMDMVKGAKSTELRFNGFDTNSMRQMQAVARRTNQARLNDALNEHFEKRALGSTATNGLEFIPEGFINQVEINQLAFSGVMQAADILRTGSGNDLPWPTIDDTSNKGALLAESGAVATDTDPSTSAVVMKAYKFTSKAVLVPYELLEDEALAPQLPQVLSQLLGERLGRIKEQFYTTGTGSSQPTGVVTASAAGITAAGTAAITADEIIRLEHSVDPAYRNGAAYMMHDTVLLAVRLLKDSEGRYLWQPGLQDGIPDRLNGRMVYVNQEMADTIAASAKTMLFGNFSKFKVREVNQMRMYRLIERYRDNDQDAFVAFCRGDSKLLNAGTNPIKHLVQAAS